jgi:hypothetical protein
MMLLLCCANMLAQKESEYKTPFEKGNGNQSATYEEAITYFTRLARDFRSIDIREMGLTDSGKPLHLVTFNPDGKFNFTELRKTKAIILINNGIHPGEPDGIDASMMLMRDLAFKRVKIPTNTVVAFIPIYNIGGALNRNSTSRVNQEGPEEYGFRGNARNYDLNRDFIKADARNTRSFTEIFHLLDADVFIDNHVSNGADYQYTLTYIMTQHNKLGEKLGQYINEEMTPAIVSDLRKAGIESTPYVNAWGHTPEKGFQQFFESPRYATGYASLFNTLGYVVETHMLKEYPLRVRATYQFMVSAINYTDTNYKTIKTLRKENALQYSAGKRYNIHWQVDSTTVDTIPFLGYEGIIKKSDVTTGDRLYYDRSKPFKKDIPFYKQFKAKKTVVIPDAYIIPQGQWEVIELLHLNGAISNRMKKDTIMEIGSYRIAGYQTLKSPYEGHYLHYETQVDKEQKIRKFYAGDFVFTTNQPAVKYLLETLEPEAVDSFFNWNFFDSILQQKEWYSDYVFEDLAVQILDNNPELKKSFDNKKMNDTHFLNDSDAQLRWIYMNSQYYESAHLDYPVYRLEPTGAK